MKSHTPSSFVVAALLTTCLAVTGCGGKDSPTAPGIQPQIVNTTDDFSYQVSSVSGYSGSARYMWDNTGVSANVNQATTVSAGSMTLVVTDAAGAEVYSRPLSDNGTFVTADGVPGRWTIRVIYSGAGGTVNFRAQKKT